MKKMRKVTATDRQRQLATRDEIATLVKGACVLEVLAPKAGNVHPSASFADTDWTDFVRSAAAIAPVLGRAGEIGLGRAVLGSVQATQRDVGRNTNLGIILMLAPLSIAASRCGSARSIAKLRKAAAGVVRDATLADSRRIYEAIALAKPGGLGTAEAGDVATHDVMPIAQAMELAAHRDQIAREWTVGFEVSCGGLALMLKECIGRAASFEDVLDAIATVHLMQVASEPESLIVRKCGEVLARRASVRAQAVLAVGGLSTEAGRKRFASFDRWLRADGNRRNPGTAADLIAAALFVHLWRTR